MLRGRGRLVLRRGRVVPKGEANEINLAFHYLVMAVANHPSGNTYPVGYEERGRRTRVRVHLVACLPYVLPLPGISSAHPVGYAKKEFLSQTRLAGVDHSDLCVGSWPPTDAWKRPHLLASLGDHDLERFWHGRRWPGRMGGCGAKAKGVVRTWCRTPNPNPALFLHQRHGALRCHIHP